MEHFRIAASLLSANFAQLGEEVKILQKIGIKQLHVDIMDGHFVPNLTMGPDIVRALRPLTKQIIDIHLMVTDPAKYIKAFLKAGADQISFHVEVESPISSLVELIHSQGKQVGLALNPYTPVEKIYPWLSLIDFVLVMTVQPGFSGGEFVPEAVSKIPLLKAQLEKKPGPGWVEVDGGITPHTLPAVYAAGAKVGVSGSYLFQGGAQRYGDNLRALLRSIRAPREM